MVNFSYYIRHLLYYTGWCILQNKKVQKEHNDNENNWQCTDVKVKLLMPTVARTCVPFERRGYDSHSGIAQRGGRTLLCYRNFYRRNTSAMTIWSDAASSEVLVALRIWSIGGRFRILLRNSTASMGLYPASRQWWTCLNPSIPISPQSKQIKSRARRVYKSFSMFVRLLHTLGERSELEINHSNSVVPFMCHYWNGKMWNEYISE